MSDRPVVVGIDLAGSSRRPTGFCILRGLQAETYLVFEDEEIISLTQKVLPDLVSIDAPLSLPKGRKSIHDRFGEHFRECDLELRRRGIKFFPITLGPMRMLTERGIRLKAKLKGLGFWVVECFPGGAQDLWGIPRKHQDLVGLRNGLKNLGVEGITEKLTGDELDAITAALAGHYFLLGKGEMLGGEEGIVMPLIEG